MANAAEMVQVALEGKDNVSPAAASAAGSLDKLDAAAQKIDGSFGKIAATAGKAAVALGAIAAIGIAAGLGAATTAAMDFEKQISAIAAVTGEGQAGIDALTQAALQLGKDTSFSAQEAAVGMEELAKAGVSVADILGGAGRASLDLAAAGAISVGDAAEIASNAMNVFGLAGSDMAHVADVVAGAANSSAIGVNDYKFALSAAGAVAATVGMSFEDLSTAIAVMGQNGLKGSDAGTSLKTMLMNLQPTTLDNYKAFSQMNLLTTDLTAGLNFLRAQGIEPASESFEGISEALAEQVLGVKDWTNMSAAQEKKFFALAQSAGYFKNEMFDANGSVKEGAELAELLAQGTAHMTDAERLMALEMAFGTDAVRAAAIMAKEGAAGFNAMAGAIGNVSAQDVANERLNNLAGSIEKLKGSAETLAITVGMRLTPHFKSMADAATEGLNRTITVFEDGWRTLEQVFAGQWEPSATIDPIVNEIGKLGIVMRDDIIPATQQAADYFTGTLVPAGREVVGFLAEWWEVGAGVVAGLAAFSVITTVVGWVTGLVAAWGAASAVVGGSATVLGGIVALLGGPLTIAIVGVAAVVGVLAAAWAGNWGDIQGKTATAIQFISGLINTGMQQWAAFWTAHGERITTIASAAWDFVVAGATNAFTLITGVFTAGMQVISGDWAGAWQTITETASAIWDGWSTQLGAVLTIIGALFAPTWNQITTETTTFLTGITTEIDTQMAAGQAMIDTALAAITGLFQAGWDAVKAIQTAAWNMLTPENQQRIQEIQQLFTELWTMAGQIWTAGTTAITTLVTAWWNQKVTEATTQYTTLTTAAQTGWDAITAVWTTVTTAIGEAITTWWTERSTQATDMMTALGKIIQDLLAPWVTYFTDTFTKVAGAFTGAVTQLGNAASELGTAIMTSLSNAIQAKFNEVVDMVTGSVKRALEAGKSLLQNFQWGAGGPASDTSDFNEYVRASALRQGIDPEQALAVVGKEGPAGWDAVGSFDTGTSYGPLQLHYAGGPNPKEGMGDRFTRDTGIDLRTDRSIEAQKRAIDYALAQASERGNWSEWYGADNALPQGRFTPVRRVQPQRTDSIQMMNQTQQEWAKNASDANSICGPYLAALFTDAVGRPPTAAEAREIASSFAYGGPAGMLRNDQVDDMANAMISRFNPQSGMRAVEHRVADPAQASRMMQQALAGGSPLVGINTQGHYFGADAYDPATGKFHVGGTGMSLTGGSDWLTVEQMTALMGPLNGIITLTGQGGAGFIQMGTDAQTMASTGQTANDAMLLSTTTLANGATVAITQLGNDVTTTIRDASGTITGQWTSTVNGLVTGATTAQTGVNAAVDIMTANSLVSVNNMGTGIITSVSDMAGTTIATTTDMNGQVTGIIGTLSSGVQVNMADMGTNVSSSVDAMTGHITTTMTTASGEVIVTTTDMAGNVLDQWVTLGSDVTTSQDATSAQIIQTEQNTSQDIRDINMEKNREVLRNQRETGRGLIESVTTDTGTIVERWMLAGGDIETIVRDSNGNVLSTFQTTNADLMADTDTTQTKLLATTTDALGRTVEVYRERTGEVVQIVTDEHGNIVEEYETTAQAAEEALSTIEEFYGGLEEVPEVDLGDVVKEYDKARKAAESYRKEAERAPDPSRGESGRDRAKGRQTGGRIDPGDLYWVGEGGRRELFMSDRAGQIIAEHEINSAMAGTGYEMGELGAEGNRYMILKQELHVQSSPADMQRYTERAMRKLASEWGTE